MKPPAKVRTRSGAAAKTNGAAKAHPKRKAGGRPPHEPKETSSKQVEAMASYGIPHADIARVIGVSENTLRKHYKAVLATAEIKVNSVVAQRLFVKTAGEGQSAVTACIFWLKTRAGWKEPPQDFRHAGANGGPIQYADISNVSDDDLKILEKIMERSVVSPSAAGGDKG